MKSEAEIYLDFYKAKAQADKLDDLVNKLNNIYQNEMQCLQGVSRDWTGDNASAYIAKATKVCDELKKIINQLKQSSNALRTAASKMLKTELNAAVIAGRSISV